MAVDLGDLIGRALENTLDAKGLTYAIADSNEIVLKVTQKAGSDGDWDFSNAVFSSDGEYQIYEIYVSDSHAPVEVTGESALKDFFITMKRNGTELLKDYRVRMGIKTLYAVHNGDKIEITSIKCPDSTNDTPTDCADPGSDTPYYVHLKVLKLIPA